MLLHPTNRSCPSWSTLSSNLMTSFHMSLTLVLEARILPYTGFLATSKHLWVVQPCSFSLVVVIKLQGIVKKVPWRQEFGLTHIIKTDPESYFFPWYFVYTSTNLPNSEFLNWIISLLLSRSHSNSLLLSSFLIVWWQLFPFFDWFII